MNTILSRQASLLGLAIFTVACSGFSAQAETADSVAVSVTPLLPPDSKAAIQNQSNSVALASDVRRVSPEEIALPLVKPVQRTLATPSRSETVVAQVAAEPVSTVSSTPTQGSDAQLTLEPSVVSESETDVSRATPTAPQSEQRAQVNASAATEVSAPEAAAVSTSAAALLVQSSSQTPGTTSDTAPATVAQFPDVTPGRSTRSGSSYIGVGPSLDFDDADLGFTILTKIGLTPRFSVRPSAVTDFDDSATVTIPLTFDLFPEEQIGGLNIAPYLGAGLAFSVGDDSDVGPNFTAGLDIPLSSRFTATAGINVNILEDAEAAAFIGLGINFSGISGLLGR